MWNEKVWKFFTYVPITYITKDNKEELWYIYELTFSENYKRLLWIQQLIQIVEGTSLRSVTESKKTPKLTISTNRRVCNSRVSLQHSKDYVSFWNQSLAQTGEEKSPESVFNMKR